jgi:hypothetical protein
MAVHVLETGYQSAGEAAAIKNWLGQTIGLRLDKVTLDKAGAARSVKGTVFTANDLNGGSPVNVESARIISQLAGFDLGDVVIVHVVAYGKRGQVLAPPPDKDKDAALLAETFAA